MKVLGTVLLVVAAVALGGWLHWLVADLTEASGTKLLIGRVLIWGAIFGALALWFARGPLVRGLLSWAERVLASQGEPLVRPAKPALLERALGVFFLLWCAGFLVLVFVSPQTYPIVFWEDGPFETTSAVLYGIAALACFLFAIRATGHGWLRLWLVLLGLLFVVVGGEEISWGQRVFDFGTPEGLAEVNVQGEFTLHNVYSNSLFVYPGLMVTALLLWILPAMRHFSATARRIFDAFEIPVAPFHSAVLYTVALVVYAIVGLRLGTPTPLPINWSDHFPHFDDEMLEFLISLQFAIFAVTGWRIVLPHRPAVSAQTVLPAGNE